MVDWSRLARALWIEIEIVQLEGKAAVSRGSREPCGLKSELWEPPPPPEESRLARALWIEIYQIGRLVTASKQVEARESLVD